MTIKNLAPLSSAVHYDRDRAAWRVRFRNPKTGKNHYRQFAAEANARLFVDTYKNDPSSVCAISEQNASDARKAASETACCVEDCESPRQGRARLCGKHLSRKRRLGGVNVMPKTPQRASRMECVIDGCTKLDCGPHGYCRMHHSRFQRNGSPEITRNPHWVGSRVGYRAAHNRVARKRGRASEYVCVACTQAAQDWAYDHACPEEKWGKGRPYSPNPDRYVPLCRSCHRWFDAWVGSGSGGASLTEWLAAGVPR